MASLAGSAGSGAAAGLWAGAPGAAIGAAAGLGSALIGKHSNNNALKAQTASTNAALANEKENEAYRRSEALRIENLQRQQFDAEQARLEPYRQAKAAFLRSQGVNIPDQARPAFIPGQEAQTQSSAPRTLATLAAMQGTGYNEPSTAQINPLTLQQIMSWGSQYGK